jgi:hypothetical protein
MKRGGFAEALAAKVLPPRIVLRLCPKADQDRKTLVALITFVIRPASGANRLIHIGHSAGFEIKRSDALPNDANRLSIFTNANFLVRLVLLVLFGPPGTDFTDNVSLVNGLHDWVLYAARAASMTANLVSI